MSSLAKNRHLAEQSTICVRDLLSFDNWHSSNLFNLAQGLTNESLTESAYKTGR